MKEYSQKRIKIIFFFAIVFLIVLSVLSYLRFNKLIDSSKWVNHTNVVKLKLGNTFSGLLEMEANQRGYILTKDSSFLKPYYNNVGILTTQLDKLDSLTRDNALQHLNIIALRKLVEKRKDYMQGLLVEAESRTITGQRLLGGKVLMDKVRDQIVEMEKEEDLLLNRRILELNREAYLTPIVTFILILFSILILIVSYYKIIKDLRISADLKSEVEKTNRELELKNEELKQNEARFSSMFDNNPVALTFGEISTNKIVYANKLFYSYFGYTAEEVIGHTSEELNLVSPEENARLLPIILSYLDENRSIAELQALPPDETAALLIKLREKMFGNGFEVLYTRKNKETFFALVFYEVIDVGNKKYALSSYQDITERKRTESKIEKQNEELIKINKELEAFNYISSHDLQEPLRKIQLFSSQIVERETKNLSVKGKEILNRIQDAALKMQTLIQDLLIYSRSTVAERKFEKTDFNKIVSEVKEDLKEELHQKHAIIETNGACEINIIPFQFRQLLYNLISNSIKFSKNDEPLIIKIESNIKQGTHFDKVELKKANNYCHISVSDNGIGFEPQYNEKIFEIFQRLYQKSEYKGTGIGLAIVKKIVENHSGHITASGVLNQGARFDIYIPV